MATQFVNMDPPTSRNVATSERGSFSSMRNGLSCCLLDGVQKGGGRKVCPKHRYRKMACSMVHSKSFLTNVVKTFPIRSHPRTSYLGQVSEIFKLRPFCGVNTQPITTLTVKPGKGGEALISLPPLPILRAKGRCLLGHRLYANGIMNNSRRNGRAGREKEEGRRGSAKTTSPYCTT